MQELISRFGGTPALILKLLFLAVINGAAVWAIPTLLTSGAWLMLGVLIVATLALDFFLLGKKFVPGKYVIIGAILLTVFQIIPIIYTVTIAFTNYSTGHIGTKEEAIATIQRDSLSESDNSQQYDMLPLYDEGQNVVLALTEIPLDTGDTTDMGDGTDATTPSPSASASVETEIGRAHV